METSPRSRTAPRKMMSVQEFVESGFLQEVNRNCLHPLGLALVVYVRGGHWSIEGVWDRRADPEGICFDTAAIDPRKTRAVLRERLKHSTARLRRWGSVVQPVPRSPRDTETA